MRGRVFARCELLHQVDHEADRAEAEEEVVLRAAIAFRDGGCGIPVLLGRTEEVSAKLKALGIEDPSEFELQNSRLSSLVPEMGERLYARLQRRQDHRPEQRRRWAGEREFRHSPFNAPWRYGRPYHRGQPRYGVRDEQLRRFLLLLQD